MWCLYCWHFFEVPVKRHSLFAIQLLNRSLDPEFKCTHPTRLETRTKESNMYASRRVENLEA